MLFQVVAVEYLNYLQYDRYFKDMPKRHYRIGRMTMFWLHREIESITLDDVNAFKKEMLDRHCQPSYVNAYLFLLRSLLNYCLDHKLVVIDPVTIRPLKVPKKPILYLIKEQVEKLLVYFSGTDACSRRNLAITALIIDSGLRIAEVLSFSRADYRKIMEGSCMITGKGNKDRPAFFTWSREYLKQYLDHRVDNHPAMFIAHYCDPWYRLELLRQDGYRRFLREATKVLGFLVSPHVLRKTALNTWKRNGMDVKSVSLIAGHTNIATTEKYYLGIDWTLLRQEHTRFSYLKSVNWSGVDK
jgi:integrase/recombinase XerD